MKEEDRALVEIETPAGGWPLAITLCVMSLSVAGCIVGSLWALMWAAVQQP